MHTYTSTTDRHNRIIYTESSRAKSRPHPKKSKQRGILLYTNYKAYARYFEHQVSSTYQYGIRQYDIEHQKIPYKMEKYWISSEAEGRMSPPKLVKK